MRFTLLFLLSLTLLSCSDKSDIKIGYVADFSSGQTNLGELCRNAAQMAIDDINDSGGIKGRKLELIPRDNGDVASAHQKIVEDFTEQGIRFIIGPFLSRNAPFLLEESKGKEMLIISPVVSSDDFAGLDDNFFTIQPNASSDGLIVGKTIIDRGDRTAVLIRDSENDKYTDSFMSGVRSVLNDKGVKILGDLSYNQSTNFLELTSRLIAFNADALVFSTLGIDAGTIIQQYGKTEDLPHLYGDEWSRTTGVLLHGGRFTEGMINPGVYNAHRDKNLEAELKTRYEETFLEDPVFFVYFTYEAIMLIAGVLEELPEKSTLEEIKDYLVDRKDFEGILGHLEFDRFGDSLRKKTLYIIRNNAYETY
ncbi:ABC transporter substrate-binding protein [Spirochaeta isovalerica]|uniref:Branched-chain amino acid transport system substrate-binding protein n=1 Tax=Spirochaeta isovalerica TaxID=150 RepID=A0A841R5C9_9SPIO|nr:ABC transporter substrate-binding protein [Spirochaeta isovalerica]MBB6480374.1 branched-chain amino acid transport system substrate-binding protein [Spirochaeta isovalerica]